MGLRASAVEAAARMNIAGVIRKGIVVSLLLFKIDSNRQIKVSGKGMYLSTLITGYYHSPLEQRLKGSLSSHTALGCR